MRRAISCQCACVIAALAMFCGPAKVLAHCDGVDGPVVKAAARALEAENPKLVLAWVQSTDEQEVTTAFNQVVVVRKLSPQARELADRYFFETVVRIHRAGEGEPYTGLKPAGRDLGPAIPAADAALETGSVEPLIKLISDAARAGLRERFEQAAAARRAAATGSDVDAGRRFVRAYVAFIHYAERMHREATGDAPDDSAAPPPKAAGHGAH